MMYLMKVINFYVLFLFGFFCHGLRFSVRNPQMIEKSKAKIDVIDTEILNRINKIKQNPPKLNYDSFANLKAYIAEDIPKSINYYDTKFNSNDIKSNFNKAEVRNTLIEEGFAKRYLSPNTVKIGSYSSLLSDSTLKTIFRFEIGKSKEQQMKDIRKLQLSQKKGIMLLLPPSLHKYIDYLTSLKVTPSKSDLLRNLAVGIFFSCIVGLNINARSSFMYYVVGNLTLMSLLLSRGMPKTKHQPGQPKRQPASWSKNSFRTALAITLLSTLSSGGIMSILTNILPTPPQIRAKISMISSLLFSSLLTSYFEVFETKSKNGWRWEKAIEGSLPLEAKQKLQEEVFGSTELNDKYDYYYDPQIDDFAVKNDDEEQVVTVLGSGDLDEVESKQHYEKWKQEKRDSRKEPIVDVPSETPWVGAKPGLFTTKIPQWLNAAYDRFVKKGSEWRSIPRKYKRDTSEFDLIDGPYGFRDKRPQWLDLFGNGVWEEQTTISRRLARSFGSYRKSMYKIDKKVVLQPCDGADKDPDTKKGKSNKK